MLDQAALAEIRLLQREGARLTPAQLIDQSRSPNSALHRYFTWDDGEAAHAFRVIQARQVLRVVVRLSPKPDPTPLKVFASSPSLLKPTQAVVIQAPSVGFQEDVRRLLAAIEAQRTGYGPGAEMDAVFADIRALLRTRLEPVKTFGGAGRDGNGTLSRFKPYEHGPTHCDRAAASLPSTHDAVVGARTLFPTRVFSAAASDHVLVAGHNNAKIGDFVVKGPWAGLNIFTLTLEERATCPASCDLFKACYGNAMPLAKRWKYDEHLPEAICDDVEQKAKEHPVGFVVRLHVLGDFPDVHYTELWQSLLRDTPQLHLFGYTAHPATSEIGQVISAMNQDVPTRCAIRFSVSPETKLEPMQATTIWRRERGQVPEGLVCPASSGDTEACGTCGLCWHPNMAQRRIVFLGHGMSRGHATVLAPPGIEVGPVVMPPAPHRVMRAPVEPPALLPRREKTAIPTYLPGNRPCLGCERTFHSKHKGHRLCNTCHNKI